MKKILLLLSTLFCMAIFLVGCSKPKEIDISKYIEISENGYDSLGNIKISLNNDFYYDTNIFPENSRIDYSQLDDYLVTFSADKSKNLKNGDIVKIQINYNEKLYNDEFNTKLVLTKNTYKISKLKKIFLQKNDLSDTDYSNLKIESEKKVTNFINSFKSEYISFEDLKFIDTLIKRKTSESSEEPDNLSLVFLYSVKEIRNSEFDTSNSLNYIFVPVDDLKFDEKGKLSSYKFPNLNVNNHVKIYNLDDKIPNIDAIKGDYLESNESFESVK